MLHNILVFDLDGTLCPIGKPTLPENVDKLRALEKQGRTIVVCSGKPTYYLCGYLRQVGLEHPVMVGENGAVIQFGVDLPPRRYYVHPHTPRARQQIRTMRERIDAACGERVWYQPNEAALTPFPQTSETFEVIQSIVDAHPEDLDELVVYRHVDSFDFSPKNINKYSGLQLLAQLLDASPGDFAAVGDGINDVPMFEFAGCAIGVGGKLDYQTDFSFDDVGQALDYILEHQL